MKSSYPGINVQSPISRAIIDGNKIIETREYPLPVHYLGVDLLLIETPGPKGKFKARAIGVIRFLKIFEYKNQVQFYDDFSRHLVDQKSPWRWKEKNKFGWYLKVVERFNHPIQIKQKRGIVFTRSIQISRKT